VEEYETVAARLSELPSLAAIEVNASCPNVKEGGMAFGATPEGIALLTARVRKATGKPLWVKLSPNVADIASVAAAAEGAGADAVSLINTLVGMAVDHRTRRPKLSNVTGGLSGPAIKPVALRMVWEVCRRVNIPVIGIGGIQTAADALEYLWSGPPRCRWERPTSGTRGRAWRSGRDRGVPAGRAAAGIASFRGKLLL
jgi:dihydroorotate dehydrogenase (NAD+) catalytic subunit